MNDDFDEARYAFQMRTYTARWHPDPKNFNRAMDLSYGHPREKSFFYHSQGFKADPAFIRYV